MQIFKILHTKTYAKRWLHISCKCIQMQKHVFWIMFLDVVSTVHRLLLVKSSRLHNYLLLLLLFWGFFVWFFWFGFFLRSFKLLKLISRNEKETTSISIRTGILISSNTPITPSVKPCLYITSFQFWLSPTQSEKKLLFLGGLLCNPLY